MKPLRWSITRRVVVAVTATVAVFVGLQAVLAYLAMDEQEDLLTDSMLHGEVQEITALTLRPGLMQVGKLQASPHVAAYLVRGAEGRASLPIEARDLGPGLYQLKPAGQVWHMAIVNCAVPTPTSRKVAGGASSRAASPASRGTTDCWRSGTRDAEIVPQSSSTCGSVNPQPGARSACAIASSD